MSKEFSRALPLVGAAALLGGAAWIWTVRSSEAARPRQLLERTYRVDNELQYQAMSEVSALYGQGKMNSKARLVRAPAKMVLTYLSGDMAGVQSGYNERWFWRRDKNNSQPFAEVTQRPSDMAARRYALLVKNYRVLDAGQETINGRASDVIELHPAHAIDGAQGPYKRLWIDRETGLTLRTDAFNYESRPVMRTVLTELNLNPQINDSTFMPPAAMLQLAKQQGWTARDVGTDAAAAQKAGGLAPPRATWLPAGFELDGYGVHHCPAEQKVPITASLARYTDGLNTLTVFALLPQKNAPSLIASATPQACDFGPGTMVSQNLKGIKLVAVGDLPPVTLQRVLDKTEMSATTAP